MKKFLFSSLVLLSITIAADVQAAELTPHDLVFQGYQGRLKSEGIPSYATFRQGVNLGKINAETLIQGAIAQGKLDFTMIEDPSYLAQVKSYLLLLKGSGR